MKYVSRHAYLIPYFFVVLGLVNQTQAQSTDSLTRGPYLQKATPTSMTFRWRTQSPSIGVVRFGPTADKLAKSSKETQAVTDHEVTVTGLKPHSKYYYSVGTENTTLQGTAENYFYTFPTEGTTQKTRI